MSSTDTLVPPRVVARPAATARTGRRRRPWMAGVVLTLGAVLTAFPFAWMIVSAVKPRSDSVAYPPHLLPSHVTVQYFTQLMRQMDFGRYLVNTLGV
ncbi:MAG: carbohydrate ABC transporter permease, partial [Cellulomonas sp.]|nr:carbohydrate ABC transporter permease [Cellulomonas sp.]